ncbi:hypothetical protein BN133_1847 [Cronobacter dublinensis 582]|nr:hypothetical protein BN133_1847 [Cronobacter dublinensis 582]
MAKTKQQQPVFRAHYQQPGGGACAHTGSLMAGDYIATRFGDSGQRVYRKPPVTPVQVFLNPEYW